VEDEPLIAMLAEVALEELGVDFIRHAPTTSDAMQQIAERRFDFALLDYALGDTTSLPIAERLSRDGIPILFASGKPVELAAHMPTLVGTIIKPYGADDLKRIVESHFATVQAENQCAQNAGRLA